MVPTLNATLVLEDGTKFHGKSFGYPKSTSGEVVFNTAMTGYPESLTDPSNEGQILVTTYPILGNYGVPPLSDKNGISEYYESNNIHVKAIVAQDYTENFSHWQADRSLSQWLNEEKIPGIYGIDTRALTKHLRDNGTMLGKIVIDGNAEPEWYNPNNENLVAKVSCTQIEEYGSGDKTVVVVDCGVMHNIIRNFLSRGVKVVRVPWNYDFTQLEYDGVCISNGPGNPDFAEATIENIKKALQHDKPICGICLGNQLLGKAAGAKTVKLPYGHRGHNQPVRKVGTNSCYITSQNHGYVLDGGTLPAEWEPLFVNMNDGTVEGIRHKSKPFMSAQFHPGASEDTAFNALLLDDFIKML